MESVSADALLDFCWCRVAPVTHLLLDICHRGAREGPETDRTYLHTYCIYCVLVAVPHSSVLPQSAWVSSGVNISWTKQ